MGVRRYYLDDSPDVYRCRVSALLMNSQIQVGSVLIEDRPAMVQTIAIDVVPYAKTWSLVRVLNARELDCKIRAAGWNFLFMAGEIKARVWGAASESNCRTALMRIAKSKRAECFNSLEVTAIVCKHILGFPYTIVSAHYRHIQASSRLDEIQRRRTEQTQAQWARG